MLDAVHLLVILLAAVCMFVPAVRHPEWRGGLMSLGFVFVSAALNECDDLWESLLPCRLEEPEIVPVAIALTAAVICAVVWRGTFLTAASAICRNRRFPILVWGLLFVTFLPNAAKAKGLWAFCAPGVEATHAVRELVEDTVRFFGHVLLLNWSLLFLRDKFRRPLFRQNPLAALLRGNELVEIGRGTRRVAYRVGDTGYCAKFYYPQEQCTEALKMQKSIQRDVKWRRFNKARNSSSAEVHVYNRFRHAMPAAIRATMPPVCVRVFHPSWGWGVLETYYTNPDGTAVIPYEFEIRRSNAEDRERIYAMAADLLNRLIRIGAPFYEPGNFHVLRHADGTMELKIVDFEPESKTAIPLEQFSRELRRQKLRRKAVRYLAHLRKTYGIRDVTLDQLDAEKAFGVRFTSFVPVAGGHQSRNYRAVATDGTACFVKRAKPDVIDLQRSWTSDMATPLVPVAAFGGRTGEADGGDRMCAMAWHDGRTVHPADLTPAQCSGLVKAYRAFSEALQRVKAVPCRAPFPPERYGTPLRTLHGDMHCGNLLFSGDDVTTFLDFEKMRPGNPAEDLLRYFVHSMERTRAWFVSRHAAMCRNFASVVRESPWDEATWLEAIALYAERKAIRRTRKSRFRFLKRLESFLRAPLYRKLASVVRQAKTADRGV